MRVATSQIYNIANIGMTNAQTALTKTQEQMASGKRVLSPADDPVAATQILQLNEEISRTEQHIKNIDVAENSLNLEETALDSVLSLVQRMQELAVSAGNTAVLTPDDYKALVAETNSRIEELLSLQNTRNAAGQYIFSGYQGDAQPFSLNADGQLSYHGDEGQRQVQASGSVAVDVSDSGKRIFVDIPSSHNTFYTEANPANRATPAARISVGDVVDQEAFDELYPDNLIIQFNETSAVIPAGANFSVINQATGQTLLANEPFVSGQSIEVAGASFSILGAPSEAALATPSTVNYGGITPTDFTVSQAEITLSLGDQTETLVLNQNITSAADLAAALNSGTNATKLARLGVVADATGFSAASGQSLVVQSPSAAVDAMLGITTSGAGTASVDGIEAVKGDSFTLISTNKQSLSTTLTRLSEAMDELDGTPASEERLAEVVGQTLANLDNAVTNISVVQGEVGARLNTLESTREQNLDTKLYTETVLNDLEALDYAEAATRLEMQQLVLSAAQQSFVKVAGLSLFNYIS
ncbi:flagellar hook-associated protein FlgL [Gilvimarinus agarilyticus]|uniref:flagellar hook-associated protein FlgL n=1 Tax=unclassified Gilvimarinus TaxID=2642066 RepID=UPI001C08734B|nr:MULTISPECIES: flagellar hook-associated protein FlgL [unclassified Gilvimarinus]MBU2887250.1 flagellar hook-associated protein FlgL [Gilvimarinus agarilyticus]MDO6571909.1 flagellar hook-associated protein FlgL [Gilvimarinus sp. 2_MG-2023]MDO6745978.1 flagellar hook-associated protein FlgL [Gilvimarinus sp. 1_MG-2023]